MISKLGVLSRRLAGDRDGMGAIEFAILFPILVMLYVGAFEVTIGLSVSKRASRAAATVADVITQQQTVTKSWLSDMPNVAASIFVPYNMGNRITLKVTGIQIDASANPTVKWSWAQDNSRPYAVNAAVTVPADLKKANSFLVRSELTVPYRLFLFGPNLMPNDSIITISRTYYYRQRQGDNVLCSDC
ncbi:TadE/TadG family type IV pilus assembly protein [Rhizobium sp. 2MFCol3.1]|uniref:TadE/TadG family type IV pilus assembly protein n=1 Tax=Rhizobium sp. 2MFCol3.1 TaxID=1246459 RepID=UPI0003AA7F9A|nr:TadE/TadG family type IV pilus assembly protein [Rhizobium sp. 2MFCol3.1]